MIKIGNPDLFFVNFQSFQTNSLQQINVNNGPPSPWIARYSEIINSDWLKIVTQLETTNQSTFSSKYCNFSTNKCDKFIHPVSYAGILINLSSVWCWDLN